MHAISGWLRKSAAFVKRDFLVESSYKAAFGLQIATALLPLFSFYFIAKLVPVNGPQPLRHYGGNYFEFVVVGIGLANYLFNILRTFGNIVRRAQTSGVLEVTLSGKTNPQSIILFSSLYTVLVAFVQLLMLLVVAWAFLGVSYTRANLVSGTVTLALSMTSFMALGILSAAVIVLLKKGDPFEFATSAATSILAGAYFPTDLLPESLKLMSQALPITHALEAMRLAIFQGKGLYDLSYSLSMLAAMSAVLLPSALALFAWAVERGRRDGSLTRY